MSLARALPKNRTGDKSAYHHGDLSDALLVEAKRLVNKYGVENISLRQVAVNVGVSPSAAYHHFPDKETLLKAAAKSAFEDMADFQERALQDLNGISALAVRRRFRALGQSYVGFAKKNPHLFRLAFGPYCAGEDMNREESRPWQMLLAVLQELDEIGDIHPAMRAYAEILIWSTIHGTANLILDGLLPVETVDPVIQSLELALKSAGKVAK